MPVLSSSRYVQILNRYMRRLGFAISDISSIDIICTNIFFQTLMKLLYFKLLFHVYLLFEWLSFL